MATSINPTFTQIERAIRIVVIDRTLSLNDAPPQYVSAPEVHKVLTNPPPRGRLARYPHLTLPTTKALLKTCVYSHGFPLHEPKKENLPRALDRRRAWLHYTGIPMDTLWLIRERVHERNRTHREGARARRERLEDEAGLVLESISIELDRSRAHVKTLFRSWSDRELSVFVAGFDDLTRATRKMHLELLKLKKAAAR
jgi:hypothetical protein